ncbi:unnamed protein product [Ceratitis capitata]|nr:unnamed protein product [Ceratitis capitata]
MSSYSFRGDLKTWIPLEEDESQKSTTTESKQFKNISNNQSKVSIEDNISNKWSVQQLMRLLRLYGAHQCLWDTRHPDNRNRKLRKAALIDIAAALGEDNTCAQVLHKINVLRATYRYEKRRIKQRIRRGIGAKTKLKWFALADHFLRNVPRSEKNKKKEDVDSDSNLEDTIVFTIDPETLISLEETNDTVENENWNIKVEPKEESKSVANSIDLDTASPYRNKTEEGATNVKESIVNEKRTWTTHESLQFVFLLRSYPLLWQLNTNDPEMVEEKSSQQVMALEEISHTMQLPKERLRKRLATFLDTFQLEMVKIKENSEYKPNVVWWPMVQEYLDTPKLPPIDVYENVKMDRLSAAINEMEQLDTSCHVAPLSHSSADQQFKALVSPVVSQVGTPQPSANNEDSNSMSDAYYGEQPNYANPPMKLIWNGLEDDLLEGKWSLKHSVKFLRLYGAHRCLWDLNDPDYRSREMRTAAIEDIAAAMGYGLDAEYVAKKIKIFRITYMQHRKRMLEAIKQNRAPDIQLRWFPLADSFLRPHIGLRSIKEQEREMPQFNFQYVYANLNLIDPALLADLK